MSYSIEHLNSDHLDDFYGKIGIRINKGNILSIPVFTFYRSDGNTENALKFKVDSMYLVTDVKKVNWTFENVDTLEEAFSFILNTERMYQRDGDIESVICVSENSLSPEEFFAQ